MIKWLILCFILVSCSSVRQVATISDSVGVIDSHTASIDSIVDSSIKMGDTSSLPTIKNHTKEIRSEGDKVKERERSLLEEIADLKDTSFFRKVVPWIPVLIGTAIFIISWLFTKNVSDTIFGGVIFLSGIAINILWTFINNHIGSIFLSLVGFSVVWFIVNYDTRKSKEVT